MPTLRVVLATVVIAHVAPFPSLAEEQALPGPTQRIVQLSGETGRLRQSIEAALDLPKNLEHFPSFQAAPQPLSQRFWSSWKFYAGLLLLTLAAAIVGWVL